jgi:hypothetical protein
MSAQHYEFASVSSDGSADNEWSHAMKQNGCSPLCMCWCFFRWHWRLNFLLHTLQGNGRSPLCVRRCLFRWSRRRNDLLHMLQINVRSSLCVFWCDLR